MASYGRGRGRGRGKGRTLGGGCDGGRWNHKCDHGRCTNHASNKCREKFGKPKWALNAVTVTEDSSGTTCTSNIVTIS